MREMQGGDEIDEKLAETLKRWNPSASASGSRRRKVVDGSVRATVDSDGNIEIIDRLTKANVIAEWHSFRVGGWQGFSGFIHPDEVPLCSNHGHKPPPYDVMKVLVPRAMVDCGFESLCLAEAWRERPAGTRCLAYFRKSIGGYTLFVSTKEPSTASVPQADLFRG